MKELRRKKLSIKALEKRMMLDASLGALTTTTVIAENDANSTPQVLDNDVSVSGSTTDFTGDSLVISTTGGAEDQLTIHDEGTGAGQVGFDGANVTYEGTLIGTLSSGGANGADLTVDLNVNASKAAIERVIENITYQNTSDNPTTSRTINFALAAYFSEDVDVTIVPQNEAPSIDANAGMTVNEGDSLVLSPAMLGVSDPDNLDTEVTFNISTTVTNGRLELTTNTGVAITSFTLDDLNNNRVQYVHDDSETTSDSFTFSVTDGTETTADQNFNITVTPVDEAPVIVTNNGADVSLGFSISIGGEAPQFGLERYRETGVGTYTSNQSLIDNQNSMFTLIFTTDSTSHTGVPGQVLFEDGGSGRGIGLYINSANELAWYAGVAEGTPELTSSIPLATSTQYAVVVEIDKDTDQIRMHYRQAGDFDWFSFGRTPEEQLNGFTDTTDLSGGNDGGLGVVGGGSYGGYTGSVSGTRDFQGSIDSPLIVYDFPTDLGGANTKLVATDVDDSAADLIYTITSNVSFGTLYRDGIALGLNDTFTQADLDTGIVTYQNLIGSDDQFTFSLYDGTNTIAGQTFDIRVDTVNTAPSMLNETVIYDEDFEGGTSGWNNNTTSTDSKLSEFWGRFNRNINVSGNQELYQTFALSGTQDYVTIEFDFFEFDTWDNEYFYVFIDDTQVLNSHLYRYTIFDTEANGETGNVSYRVQELTDGLGYLTYNASYYDQVLTYSLTVKTTDTNIKLGFGSSLNSTNLNDESFGIDNIRIAEVGSAGAVRAFQVSELAANNDLIGFVEARDPDAGQSLSYSVTGGTGAGIFAVDSSSGEIVVADNSTIDYESGTTSYTLTVRATDNGPGLLFDEQTVTINIQDAFENTAPVFTTFGPFIVSEDAAVNDDVGTIVTTDAESDSVNYSIVAGNGDSIFKINSSSGLIEINNTANLDYDRYNQYVLTIRATDDNDLSKYTDQNVTINITDINEAPLLNIEDVIETQYSGIVYSVDTGNFYTLVTTNLTFDNALSYAETQLLEGVAGHLVTITSAAENAFVDTVTTTHAWIALSDAGNEGEWYWMAGPEAGTQLTKSGNVDHGGFYNRWAGSEPNSGTGANYAIMNNNDSWYDDGNGNSRHSVIEWEGRDVINNDTYLVSHVNPDASDVNVGDSIGFVKSIDPEGDALSFSIEAGNADGIFELDSVTGELRILDITNLDATITDTYVLTVRATETVGGKFTEIDITIKFDDRLSLSMTDDTLEMLEDGSVLLTTSNLNISDPDGVAADTQFRLTTWPANGHLELTTYPGYQITSFTLDDLQNDRVVYMHDAYETTSDSFEFSVSDGAYTISGTVINVDITLINLAPAIDVNTGATVLEGGSVTVTQAMLDSSDPDSIDTPDQLTYTVTSLVNGHIEVNSVSQNTFTQADVNNNLVVFVHNGSEGDGGFDLSLADGGEDGALPVTATFTVTKTDVNDAPLITTNNVIDVVEGQTVTVTTADLNVTDPDDSATGIVYTLSGIINGFVELSTNLGVPIISFTQNDLENNRVVFRHDGNEGDAGFDISVADGGEDGALPATAAAVLNKLDVNDAPTIGVNAGASVNQNSIVVIKNSVLSAADSDDSGVGLTFTVTGTSNGQVELASNPNVAIASFTQDDIDNSRLVFRHSGPPTTAGFDFILADGGEDGAGTVSDTFSLSVDNVNDAPVIATNATPTMNEGTTLVIDTTMLDSFDPDDFGADLTWAASSLSNGILQVSGVTQNTFTQADLDAGLVTFVHDDSETTTAGFDIQVADGGEDGALPDTDTFTINVTPVNEAPTLVVNDGDPNVINFNDYTIDPFDASQDGQGGDPTSFTVSPDGTVLTLSGNAWKKVDFPYTLTANTVLSFEFRTDSIVEIAGIGFDDASGFGGGVNGYQLNGTQVWNGMDQSFRTYQSGDGWVRFDIPIGLDYTGPMTQLVFVLDDDASPTGNLSFRNVNFYENSLNLEMDEGGTFNITNAHLNSTDPDDSGVELTFTASNITNGHIEVGGVAQNTFTQDDIDNNRVAYIHDGSESLTAGFDISLADGGEDGTVADTGHFDIVVNPLDDAPAAATNNGLSINEGATVTISALELTTSDVDTEPRKVVFDITSNVSHGRVERSTNPGVAISSFTLADIEAERVRYVHDGTETIADSFDFTVRDGTTTLAADTFSIAIAPQNDGAVITGDLTLGVNEGATITLTTTDLNAVDPDDNAAELTYTASNLSNGHIEVGGIVQNTFTLQDIIDGDVVFVHDGSETISAGFDISLADGLEDGAGADTDTLSIIVTPVNDAPTALNLSHTSVLETTEIGTVIGTLSTTDADLPSDTFTYSILADPDGKFDVVGDKLVLNDVLDYEAQNSHSVTIRTNDGNGGTFDRVFTINVMDNAAPTGMTLDHDSVEENVAAGTLVGMLEAADPDLPGDVMTYALMSNPDNIFVLHENSLLVQGSIDFETTPEIDIVIRVTDLDGNQFDRAFTIHVNDLREAGLDGFVEPETHLRPLLEREPFHLSSGHETQRVLQTFLNPDVFNHSRSLLGDFEQILRTYTTQQIQNIPGLEQSIVLPTGVVQANMFLPEGTGEIPAETQEGEDYTNLREMVAFLRNMNDLQEDIPEHTGHYDVNDVFVDVLTYQEQRQEKLRQALSS